MQSVHFSLLLQRAPVEAMLPTAALSMAAWVVLSDRYHVRTPGQTRSVTTSSVRISSTVPTGGISEGCSWKKFYNRGWVDYVLLVLTPHPAVSR